LSMLLVWFDGSVTALAIGGALFIEFLWFGGDPEQTKILIITKNKHR